MGFAIQYPIDLRIKVLAEYKAGVVGYKTLAVKYGLPRDTVRYWVLQQRDGRGLPVDTKNEKLSLMNRRILNTTRQKQNTGKPTQRNLKQ